MTQIPDMTHPLGRVWDQPKRENILLDETHAVMSEKDFAELCEYSRTIPSGKYVGKMWKAKIDGKWFLVWYDYDPNPDYLTIPSREILLIGE